jgi:predicted GNAT family N-acyltransferase
MELLDVIKATTKEQLECVYAIRKAVFVDEQNCPPELELAHEDESVHFLALLNSEPCGTCRWRKTDKGYKLERFAVLKPHRGKRIGQALVAAALADLPMDPGFIYLNAQLEAMHLYARFGFVQEGDTFDEAGMPHCKMVKRL